MKEYINICLKGVFTDKKFIDNIIKIKPIYFIFTAILLCSLLYMPVLVGVLRLSPSELYSRLYTIDIKDFRQLAYNIDQLSIDLVENKGDVVGIELKKENTIENSSSGIVVVNEINDNVIAELDITKKYMLFSKTELAYIDRNNRLSIDIKLLPSEPLKILDYNELFDYLAIYNNYFGKLLFSITNLLFIVILALQLLFYFVVGFLLVLVGLNGKYIKYLDRIKILLSVSLIPSIICCIIGFFLPAVHLLLFQFIVMLFSFKIYKNYGKYKSED